MYRMYCSIKLCVRRLAAVSIFVNIRWIKGLSHGCRARRRQRTFAYACRTSCARATIGPNGGGFEWVVGSFDGSRAASMRIYIYCTAQHYNKYIVYTEHMAVIYANHQSQTEGEIDTEIFAHSRIHSFRWVFVRNRRAASSPPHAIAPRQRLPVFPLGSVSSEARTCARKRHTQRHTYTHSHTLRHTGVRAWHALALSHRENLTAGLRAERVPRSSVRK